MRYFLHPLPITSLVVILSLGAFFLHDGLLGGAVVDWKEAGIGIACLIVAMIVAAKVVPRSWDLRSGKRWAVHLLFLLIVVGAATEITWASWVHSQREWQVMIGGSGRWEVVMFVAEHKIHTVPKQSLRPARFYETGVRVRCTSGEELTMPRKFIFYDPE